MQKQVLLFDWQSKVAKMFYKVSKEKTVRTIKHQDTCQTKSTSDISSSKDGYATVSNFVVHDSIKIHVASKATSRAQNPKGDSKLYSMRGI